jgi:hypothetical protein
MFDSRLSLITIHVRLSLIVDRCSRSTLVCRGSLFARLSLFAQLCHCLAIRSALDVRSTLYSDFLMTSTDLHCLELIKTCALASSRLTTTGAKCAVCTGRVNYSMLTAQSTNCTTCAVLIAYCELFNFKRLKGCKCVANALPSTFTSL